MTYSKVGVAEICVSSTYNYIVASEWPLTCGTWNYGKTSKEAMWREGHIFS